MANPFQDSFQEQSIDQLQSSLPVCFDKLADSHQIENYHQSEFSSPKTIIDIERLSDRFYNTETKEEDLSVSLKETQKMLRQLKGYSQSLLQRNLQIVLELQHEKMKNKQLLNTLNFIKSCEQQQKTTFQEKITHFHDLTSKYTVQKNRCQILTNEVNTLKLQNGYLKQLILIANQNYETLELNNKQLIARCADIEQDYNKREVQMLKKSEEIKSMLTAFVIEKNQTQHPVRSPLQQRQKGNNHGNIMNGNATVSFNSNKSIRKQPVQDAYRQLFIKTLKTKKQNKN